MKTSLHYCPWCGSTALADPADPPSCDLCVLHWFRTLHYVPASPMLLAPPGAEIPVAAADRKIWVFRDRDGNVIGTSPPAAPDHRRLNQDRHAAS